MPVKKAAESEEIAVCSLAPFGPKPKIFFEDVKVGTTAKRQLLIKNPLQTDVKVCMTVF